MRRKLAAGNWKMHGLGDSLSELKTLADSAPHADCDILICPPATLLSRAAAMANGIHIGGQDCHSAAQGAHTGDISAAMLRDAGASHVILGHSERRQDHQETDAMVRAKAEAAFSAQLTAIICVGESLAEREAGTTLQVIGAQLDGSIPDAATAANTVVAYEPIWAIGSGLTPTLDQIQEVHEFMRAQLGTRFGAKTGDGLRLLYGGSVKPDNAAEIFAVSDVDGALVGGASLKAADFSAIITALSNSPRTS